LNESSTFKKLKTGDSTWSKIDKIIAKDSSKLILFEVPKGVSLS